MTAAGLYVHIPFCSSRCSYCDFATGLYQTQLAERYVRALVEEIKSSRYADASVNTIYFGGGTPSLLGPSQLEDILRVLRDNFRIAPQAEITLEINPGSANPEKLRAFRNSGINRTSFGAQTFDDAELAKLGRSHSAADALRTFADLREAGFANVSFDLIAGVEFSPRLTTIWRP
jgi:oxygen-independent coproporphyrinogen-3 oxidase